MSHDNYLCVSGIGDYNQWRSQYEANGAAAPPELPKVTPPICPDPLSFFSSSM